MGCDEIRGWVLVGALVIGVSACVSGQPVEPSPTVISPSSDPAASAVQCDIALDDPCVAWRVDEVDSAGVEGDVAVGVHRDGRVAAYDAATGAMRWERPFPTQVSVAAVRPGHVYLTSSSEVFVLSTADGTERWRRNGSLADPAETSGIALVHTDGAIEAVALEDGETVWSVDVSDPIFFFVEGLGGSGRVILPDSDSAIAEYDRTTGQQLWRYETAETPIVSATTSTLAAVRQTGDGGDRYIVIDRSGNVLAEHDMGAGGGFLATVDDHLVELRVAGGVLGIDAETGAYAWELPIGLPLRSFGDRFFDGFRLPATALVVGANLDGVEVIAMIDPESGQQRWQMRANLDVRAAVVGSTYVVLVRPTVTTWHDRQTGELAATIIIRNPRILSDNPAVVLSDTSLVGLQIAG